VFSLDSRLEHDTHFIGDFTLCRLLLCNDSLYPWFILVPRRAEICEVFELAEADQLQLWRETSALAECLDKDFSADKMNVAALGNVVSQLHMHVIVRYKTDAAWPAPVWGKQPAVPYAPQELAKLKLRITTRLAQGFDFVEAQA